MLLLKGGRRWCLVEGKDSLELWHCKPSCSVLSLYFQAIMVMRCHVGAENKIWVLCLHLYPRILALSEQRYLCGTGWRGWGPTVARVCIEVYLPCYHWRLSGCLVSGMPPVSIWVFKGHNTTGVMLIWVTCDVSKGHDNILAWAADKDHA